MHSLHLPQWSRTAISVDIRVGLIYQKTMGNGINWWQRSSALQTMAHKHPLTSGQMRERRGGGWARVWRIVCEPVCVSVFMCMRSYVWVRQRERVRGRNRDEMVQQNSRENGEEDISQAMIRTANTLPLKKRKCRLWVRVQTFHSSF